jgi:dihydroorotate dehydrogenase (fumarate)
LSHALIAQIVAYYSSNQQIYIMADLSINYMGLKLSSPIIVASSGLTSSLENIKIAEKSGAGAVVLKSLFEEQISNAAGKTYKESEHHPYPEALDYINHYTRANDLENYLNLIREAKKAVSIPVIASINCMSSAEWTTFAKSIQEAGADAIELNIFILPSDPLRKANQSEQAYFEIIQSVLKQVSIPVAAKISHYFSGFANMAMQLSWTGIKGLVLFNRFYSPDIDIEKFEITSTNVFSSPGEASQVLRWVAMLSGRVQCDIAATTGIHNGEAVIKQLLAGANAVQVASILYKNGIEYIGQMNKEIETWMDRHQFASTRDFMGRMSLKAVENPAAFERVQFMKHFSGVE